MTSRGAECVPTLAQRVGFYMDRYAASTPMGFHGEGGGGCDGLQLVRGGGLDWEL